MIPEKQNFIPPSRFDFKNKLYVLAKIFLIPVKLLPYFLFGFLFLAVVAVLVGVLSLLPYFVPLKAVYTESLAGQAHLNSAEAFIRTQKFSSAGEELGLAEKSFSDARINLLLVEKAVIFKNEYLSNQLSVANNILFIGENLSRSLKQITGIGQQVLDILQTENISFSKITGEQKVQVLSIITNSINELESLEKDFAEADDRLGEISRLHPLFVFNSALEPLQERIPQLRQSMQGIVTVGKMLPAFAGYPKEITYLLLMENNREMRPSGGFIGTYGILDIKNANIEKIFTDNSYNLDVLAEPYLNIPAPEPIRTYMKQEKWFFRDSNWWPDFPTSAQKAEFFYSEEGGGEVDGVIAFTPTVLEEILGVLGEFSIDGLTFNKANFWDQLEYQVEYGYYKQGIPVEERKDIIGDLGRAIMARLYELPMNQWPALINVVRTQTEEKQILLYFNDPALQALAMENDLAGEVKDFSGDYLMLVDANLAALKTDSVMDRTLRYSVTENDNGDFIAEARVNYQNLGDFTWKTTRYRSYTRLYAPESSELLSMKIGNKEIKKEDVDIYNEFGKIAFGIFFEVEPKTSKEVVWRYKLPAKVVEKIKAGEYNLLVQKQAGIPKINLQLEMNFKQRIINKENISFVIDSQKAKHAEVLTRDKSYSISLE